MAVHEMWVMPVGTSCEALRDGPRGRPHVACDPAGMHLNVACMRTFAVADALRTLLSPFGRIFMHECE